MIIITGANFPFYYCIRQFLNTIKYFMRPCDKLYVVDLGLHPVQKNFLLSRNYNKEMDIEFVSFSNMEEYPAHCKDLGSYAFKAMAFNELVVKPGIRDTVVWLDSANIVYHSLLELEILIHNKKIYSPYSAEDIKRYCYPLTIERLNYKGSLNNDMLSGGLIGINCKEDIGNKFLLEFIKACLDPAIITPEGSNKSNHRQDQSVLTILYWKYNKQYGLSREKEWKYVGYHNNLWLNEIQ